MGLVYLVAVDSGVVLRLANIGGKKSLDISLDGYSIRLHLGKFVVSFTLGHSYDQTRNAAQTCIASCFRNQTCLVLDWYGATEDNNIMENVSAGFGWDGVVSLPFGLGWSATVKSRASVWELNLLKPFATKTSPNGNGG